MKKYIKATVLPYQTLWDWIRDYQGDPDSELNIIDVRLYPNDLEPQYLCPNVPYCQFIKDASFMEKGERMQELERIGQYYDVMKVTYNPDLDRYYIEVEHND
jgi:hypothetical protein